MRNINTKERNFKRPSGTEVPASKSGRQFGGAVHGEWIAMGAFNGDWREWDGHLPRSTNRWRHSMAVRRERESQNKQIARVSRFHFGFQYLRFTCYTHEPLILSKISHTQREFRIIIHRELCAPNQSQQCPPRKSPRVRLWLPNCTIRRRKVCEQRRRRQWPLLSDHIISIFLLSLSVHSHSVDMADAESWHNAVLYQPNEEMQILLPENASCQAVRAFLNVRISGSSA